MSAQNDGRLKHVRAVREEFKAHEREELERIRHKVQVSDRPIDIFESKFLIDQLTDDDAKGAGAPPLLTVPHSWIARHYRWSVASGEKSVVALQLVSTAWGVSESTVRECAREHKDSSMSWLTKTKAEIKNDPLRRAAVVTQMLETMADKFKSLRE